MKKPNNTTFGCKYKEGNHINILKPVKDFFYQEKGIIITHYFFTTESHNRRLLKNLNRKILHRCEICSKELYEVEPVEEFDSNDAFIRQKKHSVFVDIYGNEHFTCSGVSRCFKRINFSPTEDRVFKDVPDLNDFVGFDVLEKESSEIYPGFTRALMESWSSKVVPFMKKWRYKDIGKINVVEFTKDLFVIENSFILFFEEEFRSQKKKELLRIIGVKL